MVFHHSVEFRLLTVKYKSLCDLDHIGNHYSLLPQISASSKNSLSKLKIAFPTTTIPYPLSWLYFSP